jgi:ABC-type dipeptide/oligopeptide/nickel transport system permease component
MLRFIVRRLLWAIPTLLLVSFGVFVAIRVGTDPVASYTRINSRATPAKIQQYKEANGLIGSIPEQYVRWLSHFVRGDWGVSIKGRRPVWPTLKNAIANTLVLGIFATVIGVTIGLGIGVIASLKQYSKFDSAASTGAFVGLSIPPYISAVLLQLLFAYYFTKWFGLSKPFLPPSGVYPPGHSGFDPVLRLKHLILPATVVAIQTIAIYSRYMRASLLDVKNSDYMRTARAKGISEKRVIVRHAMRNALIPVTTVAAIDIGGIIGGLIITERIFGYNGMGDYFLSAFETGDFPLLMPWLVIVVISLIFFNLMADVSYAFLDPRIRL